jgi:hypothetical protein
MNDLWREICKIGFKTGSIGAWHNGVPNTVCVLCKRTSVGQRDANRLEHQHKAVFPAGRYVGSRDRGVFKGLCQEMNNLF